MKLRPFTKLIDSRPGESSPVSRSLLSVIDWLRDLTSKMLDLTFEDNFSTYTWEGTIPASTTETVIHGLDVVPSGRLIFRCSGAGELRDSTTPPTNKFWYLENISATDSITATVIFFR